MCDSVYAPPQDAKKKGPSEKELLRTAMVRRVPPPVSRFPHVHVVRAYKPGRWGCHAMLVWWVPLQTNVLERRLFVIPSFKIYGSCAGFYDYGPPGCAIKQNVTQLWRQHFVLEEGMLEVCSRQARPLHNPLCFLLYTLSS